MFIELLRKTIQTKYPSLSRSISVSSCCQGKRNFRKFVLRNRGTKVFKIAKAEGKCVANYGPQPTEEIQPYLTKPDGTKFYVPELIPEFIVPDLTGCKFKPYVSYQAPNVVQTEFTPEQLFDFVYRSKIVDDFRNGKLGPDGQPLEPSSNESLTPEEAFINARKTGSDIF